MTYNVLGGTLNLAQLQLSVFNALLRDDFKIWHQETTDINSIIQCITYFNSFNCLGVGHQHNTKANSAFHPSGVGK